MTKHTMSTSRAAAIVMAVLGLGLEWPGDADVEFLVDVARATVQWNSVKKVL